MFCSISPLRFQLYPRNTSLFAQTDEIKLTCVPQRVNKDGKYVYNYYKLRIDGLVEWHIEVMNT